MIANLLIAATMATTQPADSTWKTIVNVWANNVTQEQADMMNHFMFNSGDSLWYDYTDGWAAMYITNKAFDTVFVQEADPQGNLGYQFLYYTEDE